MDLILFYLGGALPLLWGVSHLFPTRSVVKNFGEITQDNQRIITMEWIIEGITLIFLGSLVIVVAHVDPAANVSRIFFKFTIAMLLILAVISLFTGFRINFLPFKLCPLIFSLSALLILLGMVI